MISKLCAISGAKHVLNCDHATAVTDMDTKFSAHATEMGLSFGTREEFEFRKSLFAETDGQLLAINADPKNTFGVGHNMFSAMTKDERKKYKGRLPSNYTHDDE